MKAPRPFPDWCVEMFNEHQTVIGTNKALLDFKLPLSSSTVPLNPNQERCQMCTFEFANVASKKEHMRVVHRIQIG